MTDTEIIESPGQPPGPLAEAWAGLNLKIGDLTDQIRADRDQRTRLASMPGIKHPAVATGTVASDGTLTLDLGGPSRGREWTLRRIRIVDSADSLVTAGGTATAVSNTFAAAAAGSVALPAGASMTGFDVTMVPAGAAVNGVMTVTNLAAGTLSYELSDSAASAGTQFQVRFDALAPSSASAQPTVNVPAIVGGSAYAITVYGKTAVTGSVAGSAAVHVSPSSVLTTATEAWALTTLPAQEKFTSETLTVIPPERLYLKITGGTSGQVITARADVLDYVPAYLRLMEDA